MGVNFESRRRILDIPCKVCGDFSSGKHYNIFACDGCAGFFKRSIRRNRQYVCKAKEEGLCIIDKTHRNQCRACRLQKCQEAGMNKDAVQHERGPRNSTLRRQQMSNFFNEAREHMMVSPPVPLNLAITKSTTPPLLENPFGLTGSNGFLCNSIINFPRFPVPLQPPVPAPLPNPAVICEAAARLLFMNVQWTKSLPCFISLSLSDQLLLLEESWRELFVLGAAQFLPMTYLPHLVTNCINFDSNNGFLHSVQEFQEVLMNIRQFQIDVHEYTCLKATVLFKTTLDKPTTDRVLSEPMKIAAIQDETQLTLNKYISSAYPGQPLRFGKLLLLLPTLRKVPGQTIEDLFFRKTIGNIPIVKIISDMYKSQSNL